MENNECSEESEHYEDWESDVLVLPSEYPEAIEETRNRVEIADIFVRECIFLFFSSEIIHERYDWEYEKERVDDTPNRESEANGRKEVIVLVWEFLRCFTTERNNNRESIECHHKNIGDEIEERKVHTQMIDEKKGMQSIPFFWCEESISLP